MILCLQQFGVLILRTFKLDLGDEGAGLDSIAVVCIVVNVLVGDGCEYDENAYAQHR